MATGGRRKRSSHVPSLFTVLPRAAPARRRKRTRRGKARANDAAAMDGRGRGSALVVARHAAGHHKRGDGERNCGRGSREGGAALGGTEWDCGLWEWADGHSRSRVNTQALAR